ncbi:MAG: hypothetical protein SFU98_19720 [Leptospiraceae bacterium]|nr:hypothetical protein [Leptospiraceae bacterium]
MKNFFWILILLQCLGCYPADPEFKRKPLRNREYSGFISRSFFQVVVEVPIKNFNSTIEKEREACKEKSQSLRDKKTLTELIKISIQNSENLQREKLQIEDQYDPEKKLISWKNPDLNRGDFQWFLEGMFLYAEDYSNQEKCIFIFRNIQNGLYDKVVATKLSFVPNKPEEEIEEYNDGIKKPDQQQGTSNTGTPTGGSGTAESETQTKKKKKKQ